MYVLRSEKSEKSYGENGSYMQVLKGISTGVEKGEMCVIQGTSGSGKSTFLNCVGGLDTVESGSICVDGTEIVGLKQNELSEYRRANLGFIFQFYNLVPNLTVKENIQVCEYLTDSAAFTFRPFGDPGAHRASEQVPGAAFRWTAAALRDRKGIDQKSEAPAL